MDVPAAVAGATMLLFDVRCLPRRDQAAELVAFGRSLARSAGLTAVEEGAVAETLMGYRVSSADLFRPAVITKAQRRLHEEQTQHLSGVVGAPRATTAPASAAFSTPFDACIFCAHQLRPSHGTKRPVLFSPGSATVAVVTSRMCLSRECRAAHGAFYAALPHGDRYFCIDLEDNDGYTLAPVPAPAGSIHSFSARTAFDIGFLKDIAMCMNLHNMPLHARVSAFNAAFGVVEGRRLERHVLQHALMS